MAGTVATGGSLSDRERLVQAAIASLRGEQREARLHLAPELADAKRCEQEALAHAHGAEHADQALCAEWDDERNRWEAVETQLADLVVEISNKEDAAGALRKVVDEQG